MNPYNYIYGIYKEEYKYLYRKWEKVKSDSDDDSQSSNQTQTQQSIKNPLSIIPNNIVSESDKAATVLQLSQLLRGVDRLKLMHLIINTKAHGCCGLDTARLLQDQCILAYAPLHDAVELSVVKTVHRSLTMEMITYAMLYAIAGVELAAAAVPTVAAATGRGAELPGREDRTVLQVAGSVHHVAYHFLCRGHPALDRHCS